MLQQDKTYYLAGPMSGISQCNFPLFDRVSKELREQGYTIISPAELDHKDIRAQAIESDGTTSIMLNGVLQTWGDFLSRDVKIVADQVDGVVLLPNWSYSKGARLEVMVALLSDKSVHQYHSKDFIETLPKTLVASWLLETLL